MDISVSQHTSANGISQQVAHVEQTENKALSSDCRSLIILIQFLQILDIFHIAHTKVGEYDGD